jgi:hypothetical protein
VLRPLLQQPGLSDTPTSIDQHECCPIRSRQSVEVAELLLTMEKWENFGWHKIIVSKNSNFANNYFVNAGLHIAYNVQDM